VISSRSSSGAQTIGDSTALTSSIARDDGSATIARRGLRRAQRLASPASCPTTSAAPPHGMPSAAGSLSASPWSSGGGGPEACSTATTSPASATSPTLSSGSAGMSLSAAPSYRRCVHFPQRSQPNRHRTRTIRTPMRPRPGVSPGTSS